MGSVFQTKSIECLSFKKMSSVQIEFLCNAVLTLSFVNQCIRVI